MKQSKTSLKAATKGSEDILFHKEKQLKDVEAKMKKLKVRVMDDEINGST